MGASKFCTNEWRLAAIVVNISFAFEIKSSYGGKLVVGLKQEFAVRVLCDKAKLLRVNMPKLSSIERAFYKKVGARIRELRYADEVGVISQSQLPVN
jgi:hypothetical protein